jgi:hypothetical protein
MIHQLACTNFAVQIGQSPSNSTTTGFIITLCTTRAGMRLPPFFRVPQSLAIRQWAPLANARAVWFAVPLAIRLEHLWSFVFVVVVVVVAVESGLPIPLRPPLRLEH